MACVIFKPDNLTHEMEDGSALIDICDEIDDCVSVAPGKICIKKT